ncbi:MAG: hypothetical protein K8R49_02855 [Candidatus Cloacimonetes bacterium]|nr:hypothetical protein [Candidatus Cloacimonadota bacterium]
MKKKFFLFVFFTITLFLNANIFIDMYQKDYGNIGRTVLIFDFKPNYKIFSSEEEIQITISNCSKDANIINRKFYNNNVLTAFNYLVTENKVIVIITINSSQKLVSGDTYHYEVKEVKGDFFKIVLDIFITKNPKTVSELESFANFYSATGDTELADKYNNIAKDMKENLIVTQPVTTIQDSAQASSKSNNKISIKKIIKFLKENLDTKLTILICIGILLIAVVIFLISFFLKKKQVIPDIDDTSLRPISGFGTDEFRNNLILKLSENGWNSDAIAQELDLPENDVTRLTGSDFDEDFERL